MDRQSVHSQRSPGHGADDQTKAQAEHGAQRTVSTDEYRARELIDRDEQTWANVQAELSVATTPIPQEADTTSGLYMKPLPLTPARRGTTQASAFGFREVQSEHRVAPNMGSSLYFSETSGFNLEDRARSTPAARTPNAFDDLPGMLSKQNLDDDINVNRRNMYVGPSETFQMKTPDNRPLEFFDLKTLPRDIKQSQDVVTAMEQVSRIAKEAEVFTAETIGPKNQWEKLSKHFTRKSNRLLDQVLIDLGIQIRQLGIMLQNEPPFLQKNQDEVDDYWRNIVTPISVLSTEISMALAVKQVDMEVFTADPRSFNRALRGLAREITSTADQFQPEFGPAMKAWTKRTVKHLLNTAADILSEQPVLDQLGTTKKSGFLSETLGFRASGTNDAKKEARQMKTRGKSVSESRSKNPGGLDSGRIVGRKRSATDFQPVENPGRGSTRDSRRGQSYPAEKKDDDNIDFWGMIDEDKEKSPKNKGFF